MKRIFNIFIVCIITTLPAFGAMDEYEKCELNAGLKAFHEWGFSEIPAEYQDKIDKIINSPVEQESSGTCTPGGNYHCNKGDIFKDCCPCAQFDAEMQVEEIFKQDYIKKECGHIKKQNLQEPQETQATNNQPDNNFDFAAASANSNASSGLLLPTSAQEDKPQPNQRQHAIESNLKTATTVPTNVTAATRPSEHYNKKEAERAAKPTVSMASVCKNSVGRLNCANLTMTCTNGFNDGWTEQKALEAMCPNEVQAEQTRREKLKNDAESRFCKSGMKFEADCKANKVVFGCDEYSRRTPNEIERKLQNYCSATKTNTVEIQDETTQKRADKKADEEKLKKTCEELGTKGKWNKTLNKCNCNEKNHIFDEETGCTAATPKFIEAQKEIENLKSQLEATITKLNK